ncbi:hypothetical protein [Nocardia abscessus]|uniref:hypothetical protein n=1 Tax=Nocardia abscessus TaxID=120957 RepID=UPI0024560451|nr:hypothetical protein [Nocardia abscessus]
MHFGWLATKQRHLLVEPLPRAGQLSLQMGSRLALVTDLLLQRLYLLSGGLTLPTHLLDCSSFSPRLFLSDRYPTTPDHEPMPAVGLRSGRCPRAKLPSPMPRRCGVSVT